MVTLLTSYRSIGSKADLYCHSLISEDHILKMSSIHSSSASRDTDGKALDLSMWSPLLMISVSIDILRSFGFTIKYFFSYINVEIFEGDDTAESMKFTTVR